MSGRLVPTVRTTPTMRDFADALQSVAPELHRASAGVLWAQFACETADGRHCYGWNLGNVKWLPGCVEDYHVLRGVWEGVTPATADRLLSSGQWERSTNPDHAKAVGPGRVAVIALPSNPASWFRSYPSLAVGMAHFVAGKRKASSRYASAWPFVLSGDCNAYARELGRKGYYTASPDAYAAAMLTKHRAWMASRDFDDALDAALASSFARAPRDLARLDALDTERPAVDVVTGDSWVLPFEIVHDSTEIVEASIAAYRRERDGSW